MCAIAGEFNFRPVCPEEQTLHAERMISVLKRRGSVRKRMIFTESGMLFWVQPDTFSMQNEPVICREGGRLCAIVFNGSLYNADEIRKELGTKGHRFHGKSDAETALRAFMEWKEESVGKLSGAFAYAVWDSSVRNIFLARDHAGIMPLFFTQRKNSLIFSSELKMLLGHPDVPAEIDLNSISELTLLGPGRTPGCGIFSGIYSLPPACCIVSGPAGWKMHRYWKLHPSAHTESFRQTVSHVRELAEDAVRRQFVPGSTGIFLSGGLDSSIIAAVSGRILKDTGEQLKTFSVDYQENDRYFHSNHFQPESDGSYIHVMQKALGSCHRTITIGTDELMEALFDAVDARAVPGMADIDASMLLLCRKTAEDVPAVLSGECADEIFGGYPWFREPCTEERFPWSGNTAWRFSFLNDDIAREIDPKAFLSERCRRTSDDTETLPDASPQQIGTQKMMRLNLDWFMQTLLERAERMGAAAGLSVRTPFCDRRIIEYLYSVPPEFRDCGGREKGLLREAVRGLIPDEILHRKKSPYPKTCHPGYRAAVSRELRSVIENPSSPILDIIKKEKLEELLLSRSETPWYGQLMTIPQTIAYFLQLNCWLRTYHPVFRGSAPETPPGLRPEPCDFLKKIE